MNACFDEKSGKLSLLFCSTGFSFGSIQSTLVILTSIISNNRLSRRENIVLLLT